LLSLIFDESNDLVLTWNGAVPRETKRDGAAVRLDLAMRHGLNDAGLHSRLPVIRDRLIQDRRQVGTWTSDELGPSLDRMVISAVSASTTDLESSDEKCFPLLIFTNVAGIESHKPVPISNARVQIRAREIHDPQNVLSGCDLLVDCDGIRPVRCVKAVEQHGHNGD